MKVSVVIPAHNERAAIGRCLQALERQNYPKKDYEIVVVDDGSTDGTAALARKHRKVKVVSHKQGGAGKARNVGVSKAKGQFILFTDADCVPDHRWIKEMVLAFADSKVGAVQGTFRSRQRSIVARFAQHEISDRHSRLTEGAMSIGTGCAAVRRSFFLKLRGFDTRRKGIFGEDTDLAYRLLEKGYKIAFAPKAFVYHEHPEHLMDYLQQKYGRGVMTGAFLFKRHGSKLAKDPYKGLRLMVEVGYACLTPALTLLWFIGLAPLALPVAALLAWWVWTIPLHLHILRKDAVVSVIAPMIILLRDIAMGLGVAKGLLKSK